MSTLESPNNRPKVLTERHRELDKKVAEDYANRQIVKSITKKS